MYQDKTITCSECGADFIFSADEQEFFASRNLTNQPKRCKPCRESRKQAKGGGGRRGSPPVLHKITCDSCGQEAEVPFKPEEGRKVFCRDCYTSRPQ